MIRSLVGQVDAETQEVVLQRNLDQKRLEELQSGDYVAWIDIVNPSDEEIEWLARCVQLNPTVRQDLQREDRRPSLMVYPHFLFLSLFQPQIRLNQVEGKEIHCLMTDNWFITVRQGDSTAVDEAYNRVAQNPDSWHSGLAYFLYLTSQFVIDAYYPLLDRVSSQLNTIEEKLLNSGTKNDVRKSVYRIKQQLINLRQMVAPQREVFSSVIGEKRVAEDSDIRDLFRHLYERLLRVYDVIDSQRDLSSNVLDMMENQESRKLAEAVSRLTILSMIFLPLTFFTGLFQLNFATTTDQIILPISGNIMFAVVMAAMIFSVGVMAFVFRRRGWL
jgi:magnesium transporter